MGYPEVTVHSPSISTWVYREESEDPPIGQDERVMLSIARRSARVGVIGLGYVGLPLVELFASAGFPVMGFDVDNHKINQLRIGQSYIGHIPSSRIGALQASQRFQVTSDFARLVETDAILICVPTPLGKHREPDLTAVTKTGEAIAKVLRKHQLVVLAGAQNTSYAAGRNACVAIRPQ